MVQTRRSRQLSQEQLAQQIEEDEDFKTTILKGQRNIHYPVVNMISEADIERKRKIRAAGATRTNTASKKMTVTGEKPIPQRTTAHQAQMLNTTRTSYANRETIEDAAIVFTKSENSDRFYDALKHFAIGLIVMGALITLCVFGGKYAIAAYNQEMYGKWPTTHYDGLFGLPNEDKDHPTHVVAINDSGTFLVIVTAPYAKNVQKYTLPEYGFNKSDLAQLSEITLNGHKTLEIQVDNNVWYMVSDGKSLVPQSTPN